MEEFEMLQKAYPVRPFEYTYEQDKLEARARERIPTMLQGVPRKEREKLKTFLDLGAWDGTNCQQLQMMGKSAAGIDIRHEGYSDRAKKSGALLTQMDVDMLAFSDNTFDFTFSYNSFEHFPRPDISLLEAIRVTRPEGYIYLNFGPLWLAPKGAHQFRTIGVPYNQCLFPEEMIKSYARRHELELIEYFWMNKWTAERFRQLWRAVEDRVETVFYREELSIEGIELISRYPSCFKAKTDSFDDLVVSYIELLYRKR